ncbi:PREDICTED: uncharacterized protein LOC108757316 [Trachymyrmex septentrionalis]|uniref:uncharacterized protein LOC108757316 n=1 Tax=Trachymyrmex septentrionalis TaxID=34720 RepID=UPI00084EDD72|nr:PREDICTED: uncharacterized protein LOC108757316 [Trachymyrmex septentrionalis]
MRKKFSRGSLLDYRIMALKRCALLPAIVITICLDVSSITTTAAVVWNPKTSRYVGSYNLDKGPVFYEAYYPDTRDAHEEKRFENTVLETSFQVPFERIAHSETTNHPVTINESFIIVDNEILPRKQWKMTESQRNYDTTSDLASFSNERSTTLDDDKNLQASNIEEISKLVRRAISRDLENWNTLEEYLDRTVHRPQLGIYSREINKNGEDGSYMFPVNRKFVEMDSPKRSSFEASLPQKLDVRNAKERPMYFEEVDTSGRTSEMSVSGTQAVDIPSPVDISDSLPPENIFQPRPQMVRYKFFKKPMPPRLDKQNEKPIDQSTPRTYGDDLIREEITNDTRDRIGENVKVTSIEISEQPRHKTRHHHGEFPHRHRSQSTAYPTIS